MKKNIRKQPNVCTFPKYEYRYKYVKNLNKDGYQIAERWNIIRNFGDAKSMTCALEWDPFAKNTINIILKK